MAENDPVTTGNQTIPPESDILAQVKAMRPSWMDQTVQTSATTGATPEQRWRSNHRREKERDRIFDIEVSQGRSGGGGGSGRADSFQSVSTYLCVSATAVLFDVVVESIP